MYLYSDPVQYPKLSLFKRNARLTRSVSYSVWKNKQQRTVGDITSIKRESCANQFLLFVHSFAFILNVGIKNNTQ